MQPTKIEDNDARAKALSAIVPYLDGQRKEEVMEKALDAVSKIEDDYSKSMGTFSYCS